MTEKNPKIRMVTLKKKEVTNAQAGCHCDDDDNCPECRVQPITCDCDPQCSRVGIKKEKPGKKQDNEKSDRTFFKPGKAKK